MFSHYEQILFSLDSVTQLFLFRNLISDNQSAINSKIVMLYLFQKAISRSFRKESIFCTELTGLIISDLVSSFPNSVEKAAGHPQTNSYINQLLNLLYFVLKADPENKTCTASYLNTINSKVVLPLQNNIHDLDFIVMHNLEKLKECMESLA